MHSHVQGGEPFLDGRGAVSASRHRMSACGSVCLRATTALSIAGTSHSAHHLRMGLIDRVKAMFARAPEPPAEALSAEDREKRRRRRQAALDVPAPIISSVEYVSDSSGDGGGSEGSDAASDPGGGADFGGGGGFDGGGSSDSY